MSALDQNVFQSNIVVDNNLNIISSDSSFNRFVNCAGPKSLNDYLDSVDCNYLKEIINNYMFKQSIIVYFNVRNTRKETIVTIDKKEDNNYSFNIFDYFDILNRYSRLDLQMKKGTGLLSLIDILFFDYDIHGCKVMISSGKSLEVIKEFKVDEFVKEISKYLEISDSNRSLKLLYTDLTNNMFLKQYFLEDYEILTTPIFDDNNNLINVIGIINDKNKSLQTRSFNNLDGLTQIINKKGIVELAKQQIEVNQKPLTIIVLDIDYFKSINDNYGHLFGDDVLIKVSKIIKDAVGNYGYVGRFGGDEFLILLNGITEEDIIRDVLRNIKLGVQWAYSSSKQNLILTCSMGCATYPKNANSYEKLFEIADKCLYLAKRKGRNCYIIYDPIKHDKVMVEKGEVDKNLENNSDIFKTINEFTDLIKNSKLMEPLTALNRITSIIKANNVSVYKKGNLFYQMDETMADARLNLVNDSYYSHFPKNGVLVNDNINRYEVVDKEFFLMYFNHQIVGSFEIYLKDYDLLICFDKINKINAKAWLERDMICSLLVIDLIIERLVKKEN